jgi:enoyl-CoA hydratase/carnithine racemase
MAVVEYEKQGHIAIIRMNRPERLNTMGYDFMLGLAQAWNRFRDDEDAWVGILTGHPHRAFCAGLDIKERLETGKPGLGMPKIPLRDPYWESELDKPTIAAVNGLALGGGFFLTIRADLRVAAESATFQITEVVRGGLAGWELELWENLPYAVAAELASGAMFSARRAYEVGLVNRLVPDGKTLDAAVEMAQGLISIPPLAVHYNLKLMRDLKRSRLVIGHRLWDQARSHNRELRSSHDVKESMMSFVEKRAPVYRRG